MEEIFQRKEVEKKKIQNPKQECTIYAKQQAWYAFQTTQRQSLPLGAPCPSEAN